MLYKITRSLFKGQYQYKIVLVSPGASAFRDGDISATLETLKKIDLNNQSRYKSPAHHFKSQEDLDYAFKLSGALSTMSDFEVRIESPWITIYSNSKSNIDTLINLDNTKVKYVCQPGNNTSLATGTVVMPKMDYDYRITLGKTTAPNPAFVEWADSNKKVKLTKSCIRDLGKVRSWGGTHFYITGDNNLLMAKMHLGGSISKIERIVKS